MADDMNVKGPLAKLDAAAAAMPQAGDIVSKLHKYLTGRGVPAKKAARFLADAIDDTMEEEAAPDADDADAILEQLQSDGVQNRTPKEIADALAEMLDRRGPGPGALERSLRERIEARLAEDD